MKRSYDSTFILDIQGKEDGVEQALADIKAAIEGLGGEVRGVQRMDRRKFERAAGRLDSGYYLGVAFDLDPAKLHELRQKFQFDARIYRQSYLQSKAAREAASA